MLSSNRSLDGSISIKILMKKRPIILLFICILTPSLLVFALYLRAKQAEAPRLFERKIIANAITNQQIKHIGLGCKSIAGIYHDTVYLETSRPGLLYRYDLNLQALDPFDLHVPADRRLASRYYTTVNYPDICIYGGNAGKIISGSMHTGHYTIHTIKVQLFSRAQFIHSNLHVLRGFVYKNKPEQYFVTQAIHNNQILAMNQIIQKQQDYGLSEDGILAYDLQKSLLVYTSFYHADTWVMDTNLRVLRHFQTIDKTPRTSIRRSFIAANSRYKYTNAAPKRIVNYQTCLYNGELYVLSRARSIHQPDSLLSHNACIDIYHYHSGTYLHSFYIPAIANEKPRQIKIQGDKLLALYKSHLATYHLQLP